MNPTAVLQAIQGWPPEDQFGLVFDVWDQLTEGDWRPDLTDELQAELARRLAAYEADPTNVVTWEDLVERVRRQQ